MGKYHYWKYSKFKLKSSKIYHFEVMSEKKTRGGHYQVQEAENRKIPYEDDIYNIIYKETI